MEPGPRLLRAEIQPAAPMTLLLVSWPILAQQSGMAAPLLVLLLAASQSTPAAGLTSVLALANQQEMCSGAYLMMHERSTLASSKNTGIDLRRVYVVRYVVRVAPVRRKGH